MNLSTLAFPAAVLVALVLGCWAIIDAKRGKWWLKLILIVTVPAISILNWRAIDSFFGWPTSDPLPDKGLLNFADIREPVKKGDEGVIYVWLVPFGEGADESVILGYKSSGHEPRAYKMPYTREMHKMLNAAMKMIREGRRVILERSSEKGERSGQRNNGGTFSRAGKLLIYELPPPDPPKKD